MPVIVRENLWLQDPSQRTMYIVTTNGFLKKDGTLVMGRGAAKEAVSRFRGAPALCGAAIQEFGSIRLTPDGEYYEYTFLPIIPAGSSIGLGIFQVKYDWRKKADLELIRKSCMSLQSYALQHPEVFLRLNFPGIGEGELNREEVEPLLVLLPDSVTVCYK